MCSSTDRSGNCNSWESSRSSDLTSYSYDSSLLTVFQQSFVFPHAITALATTSTKFGISTKDLLGELWQVPFAPYTF
jgi:hypothetical protein